MRKQDKWNVQGEHCVDGEESCYISSYKLPTTNQDTERRNFPGYQTYTPGEALMDEISCEGSTETRSGGNINHSHTHAAGELKRRFK